MHQGGVSLEKGSLHSISSTVYFLQPTQYFNSEVVPREVLLLQSQVRSARGMDSSSSAVALFSWDADLPVHRKGWSPPSSPPAVVADLPRLAVTASASPGNHQAHGDALG